MSRPGNETRASDLFMPALLDRLSRDSRGAVSRNAFRKTVLRDLAWLLNCTNLEGQLPLEEFPRVKRSVINFGIPTLAGERLSESDLGAVADGIKNAITCFEPRILEKSLRVTIAHGDDAALYNRAHFRIEATYWFEPYPIDMVIRAQWDMETGGVEIREER
ncbi:MAG: type VI secretion system baseplate subunit TssE [Azoarcus sp.]|jgi:type VI secretion system protein ImpF|nr:type VI secretion system baseplate subunit TssE [Azoarcus sp.]